MAQRDEKQNPEDICARFPAEDSSHNAPHAPPILLSSVYHCTSPEQADRLLAAPAGDYVYRRDGHPNASQLESKCRALHRAAWARVTSSGMSALLLAAAAGLQSGDHLLVSNRLYGATAALLTTDLLRWGITSDVVDTSDMQQVEQAITEQTRWLVVETITNPLLHVSDLPRLAELAHRRDVLLLVDNTLASPVVCRPLDHGADLVIESLTKLVNGHSDVVLGLLCGRGEFPERIDQTLSRWGLASSPMDCWLAERGIRTLALRVEKAAGNALQIATWLAEQKQVARVHYAGLPDAEDHPLAGSLFLAGQFGTLVTFTLAGGRPAADKFIGAVREQIPFCPSLGELSTTLSHPATTSHRALTSEQRERLGIDGGTIRLSVGIENAASLCTTLEREFRIL